MANTSIRVDTVGLGIAFSLGETYRVAIDEGFLEQEGGLQLPLKGNASIMTFSTPANPPQIANTIPTHTSTAPINISNVSFTIDRSVGNLTILGGNVFLNRQGSPNIVVKTFAVSNASVSGNTVAFSVIGNLEASQTYFITSNANIFLDRDGFKNNAITNSSSFRFVSPTAPTVTAFTPANASIATANFTNVAIDFDRTIFSNSGNLFLHNANTNAVIRTYSISSALISNNKVTLNVVGNIDANGYYYIKSNANVVMDVTQIKYPGLTNASTFTFKAPTSPFITSTSPAISANVSRTTTGISLTLDRTVTAVSGDIYLYNRATPNVLLKTWTIGSNVSFDSDRTFSVIIPQGMLAPTQNYFVTTNANIAKDLTYINYPGISSNTAYTFSTGEAPLLSSTSPAYGQAADENDSNISFTMDRLVSKNVGNLYLYKIDTVNGNSLVKTYNIVSNTYLISNQTVNLPITNTLSVMESYYVNSDYDILKDYYNNEKYQGIIDANTFVFTTAVDRSYVIDRTALLFPNNIPQITEADTGATYTVSLQLSSAVGQIQANGDNFASPTGWTAGTRTYSVTGSKTTVNSALSNLYFFPFANTSSSATITYSLTKNSIFQKSLVFSITSSANPGYLDGGGNTYSIAEDSKFNFMPFYIYPSWNSNCVVMLKSIQSGNVAIDPGKFYANTASGWTNANDGVIYKAFSRPANIAVYNSQVAEVRDIYYWLSSDYTTSFTIDALLGIESTPSGNTLTGGTVYSVTNTYNITPAGEYSLTTSSTYTEDTYKAIDLIIVDGDIHPSVTYNVQIQQISPDPGLNTGAWTSPGNVTKFYSSLNDTSDKSTWNATNSIVYYPPGDYTGNIALDFSLTKIQPGKANIALATNVAITLTNSVTDTEYSVTQAYNYTEDQNLELVTSITDNNALDDTYWINIKQISPDPTAYPANIIINSTTYTNNVLVSGTKSSLSGTKYYSPPADYTGNVLLTYTQIKNNYNGNITQASNIALNLTCTSVDNEYTIISLGPYNEDTFQGFGVAISDNDSRFNYWINVKQISPDPTTYPANIIIGANFGTNVWAYGSKTTLNGSTKAFYPPGDYTGNITLVYTQIKNSYTGNIIQASNIALNFTNSSSHDEYFADYFATSNIGLKPYSLVPYPLLTSDYSSNNVTFINSVAFSYSSSALWTGAANSFFTGTLSNRVLSTGTIEFWINSAETGSVERGIFDLRSAVGSGTFIHLNSNGNYNFSLSSLAADGSNLIPRVNNSWEHLAMSWDGSNVRLFLNGTLYYTIPQTAASIDFNQWTLGAFYDDPSANGCFKGQIDEVRVSNIARYTGSSFTLASAEHTVDANTVLLLHLNSKPIIDSAGYSTITESSGSSISVGISGPPGVISTNASNISLTSELFLSGYTTSKFYQRFTGNLTVYDYSKNHHNTIVYSVVPRPYGNLIISDTVGLISNTGAYYFNGGDTRVAYTPTGSLVGHAAQANLQLGTGNWTWEMWVNPLSTNNVAEPHLISYGNGSYFQIKIVNGNLAIDRGSNNTTTGTIITNRQMQANVWQHIAVTRVNNSATDIRGNIIVHYNGNVVATTSINGNMTTTGASLTIGANNDDTVGRALTPYYGYMEEIIFAKQLKYVSNVFVGNFTPATITSTISPIFDARDQAVNKNYSIVITQNPVVGNLYIGNVNQGNSVSLSGNIISVRSSLANLILLPNYTTANITSNIYYTQTQTTDNIIHANQLRANIEISPSRYFTLPSSILITDYTGFNYYGTTADRLSNFQTKGTQGNTTITVYQNPVVGKFYNDSLTYEYGNTLVLSGKTDTINSILANVRYAGPSDNTTTFYYNQSVAVLDTPLGNVVASNIAIPVTYSIAQTSNTVGYFDGYQNSFISGGFSGNATNIGTGDFTVSAWVYDNASDTNNRCIFDNRNITGLCLHKTGTDSYRMFGGLVADTTFSGRIENTWQHIAIGRNNGNVYAYLNGNLVSTTTSNTSWTDNTWYAGAFYNDQSSTVCWKGYLDEIYIRNNGDNIGANTISIWGWNDSGFFSPNANEHLIITFSGANTSPIIGDDGFYHRTINRYGNVVIRSNIVRT